MIYSNMYLLIFINVFQVLVIVSSMFLLASILMLILSTVPEFQVTLSPHRSEMAVCKQFLLLRLSSFVLDRQAFFLVLRCVHTIDV
jgi:hypothetical protein